MLATILVLVVLAFLLVPTRLTLALSVVGVASVMVHPLLGVVMVGLGVFIRQVGRIQRSRARSADAGADGVLAVELVGLGVLSGLPFRNAAALTALQLEGSVSREITKALRSINAGQEPSIELPDIHAMFNAASVAETTGMPLGGRLNAMAADRRRAVAAVSREQLAKLPVKMLFPLAFLILPGFVLLTVVPPLMSGLSKLGV